MVEKILFIDDDETLLSSYKRTLGREYQIDVESSGEAGLKTMIKNGPYAVVVTDYKMSGMDGLRFLTKAQLVNEDTVRVMLTGHGTFETAVEALNQGKVFQFLTKPCEPEAMNRLLQSALRQYRLIQNEKVLLDQMLNGAVRAFSDILEVSDPESFQLTRKLREEISALAAPLKLEIAWEVEIAAMLCKLGNVTVPPAVLKRSRSDAADRMPPEEMSMITRVPEVTSRMVRGIDRFQDVGRIILYMAKNFDGTGYPPDTVKFHDIPFGSRLLRILVSLFESEENGVPRVTALEQMKNFREKYDVELIDTLIEHYEGREPDEQATSNEAQALTVEDLKAGMELKTDVFTKEGMLVLPAGSKLSLVMVQRILNFSEAGGIKEPIYVK